MGKDRKVHEVVGELMAMNSIDEKALAEKVGVSELVILNYLSGLNKDSRNYARLKGKIKAAFDLGDDFFDESHIAVAIAGPTPKKEKKAAKSKKEPRAKKEKAEKKEPEGSQLVFDIKGDISEEKKPELPAEPVSEVKAEKVVKAAGTKKQSSAAQDPLMSAIKTSGSKARLSGKKKDITPDDAARWASEYEDEIKQSISRAFDVMRESLKDNFKEEEPSPIQSNKKISEIVELASKIKEDDLILIIAMMKKLAK